MEKQKLISMTDFVLEQYKNWENDNNPDCQSSGRYILATHTYANFLKQPLTLGMFVPCDEDGNVLIEPYNDGMNDNYYGAAMDEYHKAKEKVLLEGFEYVKRLNNEVNKNVPYHKFKLFGEFFNFTFDKIVEDCVDWGFSLSESAIKKITNHP